ncbi:FIST signal transduction protein [Paracoccus homiensis]|nr:FIST N-terminal domain-containing protein [Paracoccus homiensis]
MGEISHDWIPDSDPAALIPRSASTSISQADPMGAIAARLGRGPFAALTLFVSINADLPAILSRARQLFPSCQVTGCTTGGEISAAGYDDDQIVAIAYPVSGFAAETVVIDPVDAIDSRVVIGQLQRARLSLQQRAGGFPHELGILLIDGLSGREEHVVASLAGGLGPVPTVGGSAGDGRRFENTLVFADGRIHQRTAILTLLRARAGFRTFSYDSTRPSQTRMVVTHADPAERAILRINDEPAAGEYARLLGRPTDSLGPHVFAVHPVLVRAGGRYHVRSIKAVRDDGALIFFGAVAEGMVLTLSDESDLTGHLREVMADLGRDERPGMILGFDCIFRRIDAEARQKTGEMSQILRDNHVAGFSTFGEQFGAMHVNQTFTGVAFYGADGAP